MSSSMPAFYNAGLIHIWVEDTLTRDYLTALWPNAPFNYLVAGGLQGVSSMANQAAAEHLPIPVFGICDRDMGKDNESKWADPTWTGVVYRPSVLEVENFLLDEVCINAAATNDVHLDATTIKQKMLARATELVWWMTCKKVLAEINQIRNNSFPPDKSGQKVYSEDDAVALLRDCDWTTQTLPLLNAQLTEPELRKRVRSAHQDVLAWIDGEDWRTQFSGKELFNWVYGQVSSGAGRRRATINALAAEIGALQVEKTVSLLRSLPWNPRSVVAQC